MTSSDDRTAANLLALLGSAREVLPSSMAQWSEIHSNLLLDSPTQQLLREVHERNDMLFGAASSMRAALYEGGAVQQVLKEMQERNDRLSLAVSSATGVFSGLGDLSGAAGAMAHLGLVDQSLLDRALATARFAESFALPSALEAFRTSEESLAFKLLGLPDFSSIDQRPEYLDAFVQVSAVSDALAQSSGIHSATWEAVQSLGLAAMPTFDTLAGYRGFFDAAGLTLPRWPRVRLLTAAEKRRRIKARLKANAEPAHVKKAKSLVHGYERVLREIIDAAMAEAYGEDWPNARLPLCECKDLLGKWRNRGGDVLDHADYAHYERIMGHPEHFDMLFEVAFDNPEELVALLNRAGRLRAASHHAREFTPEDLRDLRLTWRTLEAGLVALTDDYVVEPLD